MSMAPNIYTFFEPINEWCNSKLLLDLWVENWSESGFEPVVLNLDDAKSHPYYHEYDEVIRSNYEKITGRDIMSGWGYYVYFCFMRHLAYASRMTDDMCLAMDYDVYNINYKPEHLPEDKIMFFANQNPCCISGNKDLFLELCILMSKFTQENIVDYKRSFDNSIALHDMGWIKYTLDLPDDLSKELKDKVIFNQHKIQGSETSANKSLIHVSFWWLLKHLEDKSLTVTDLSIDDKLKLRYTLAKEQLTK